MKVRGAKKRFINYTALDFFAGSGLVTYSLRPYFNVIWANDICPKKADVYIDNHGENHFCLESIENINGKDLPKTDLSWASFPCQDLSLAGKAEGINAKRSGLVWDWLRVMDEMEQWPELLVAENVAGFITGAKGENYKTFHKELTKRGYKVGPVLLDAARWVPQSRPRIFVIAVKSDIEIPGELKSENPNWVHSDAMIRIQNELNHWIWWNLPEPTPRQSNLTDIIEWDAPRDNQEKTRKLLRLLSPRHLDKLNEYDEVVATGYKRTRNGKQTLELRFDGIAGCLRTPQGGSSRQFLIFKNGDKYSSRLLSIREIARLMGASESYILPEVYNDAYKAMGDAIAVPAVQYLTEFLLFPLMNAIKMRRCEKENDDGDLISAAYGL
ncbi:MAG TPA: DNA (cytosine-5-)-methyltransferase [Firmicutes bacterium]|jgi:DNA (cytosine-5)-methyltransferase 1|nr:DNA (cytosine-5-)-methyltransferase [Bacillota bacterium]